MKFNPHEHRVFAACVFLSLCILLSFLFASLKTGQSWESRYLIYSVRFEYYGVDASEIEKTITMPLEESISSFSGLLELVSTAEYGQSYTTAYFSKSVNAKNTYLALRDAVDTLYRKLPAAVQKPRIFSSKTGQSSVITISASSDVLSVDEVRRYVEKNIKEKIEAIDGAAEVIVSGGNIEEIRAEFDLGKLASGGINPLSLGNIIQDANVILPNGKIKGAVRGTNFNFDTRLTSIDDIAALPVSAGNGDVSNLSYFAEIKRKPRAQEEIVRINGKESIIIQVKAASNGNSIIISDKCNEILKNITSDCGGKIDFKVLRDNGSFIKLMLKNLLVSALESFVLIVLLVPLFYKKLYTLFLIVLVLPVNIFFSLSLLAFAGFSFDQNVLAGISIALGLIVDPALVVSELAENRLNKNNFLRALYSAAPALTASAVTTLAALTPLYFLEYIIPGIRSVTAAIAFMVLNSILISLIFLPCFIYAGDVKTSFLPPRVTDRIKRFYTRAAYRAAAISIKYKKAALVIYGSLFIMPFAVFFISGKNISMESRDDVINFYVEFESEKAPFAVEKRTSAFIEQVERIEGVRFVSSEARRGALEVEAGFDGKIINARTLAKKVQDLSLYVEGGFLYVPDASEKDDGDILEVEIAVIGEESVLCRETARLAASALSSMGDTEQVVLNFKEPEETVKFLPYRDVVEKSGMSIWEAANIMRFCLFGPVVDKWVRDGEEIDIRVQAKDDVKTYESLSKIYIPASSGSVRLETLGDMAREASGAKIYRKDGRRAAYITVCVHSSSIDKTVRNIKERLSQIDLPSGYGFSFSHTLEDLNLHYGFLLFAFIASIVFILIFLTALNENFIKSLLVASIIPVSASLPLLLAFVINRSIGMGDVAGMVVIAGLSVNNAIFISESKKGNIYFMVRDKIQSLIVSSLTTSAGALPLFFASSNDFSKSLAFFIFAGVLCSVFAALFLFPALYCVCGGGRSATFTRGAR